MMQVLLAGDMAVMEDWVQGPLVTKEMNPMKWIYPDTILFGTGLGVTSADAGDSHMCAILTNNALKCWGKNDFGQLGYGNGLSIGDDDNEMGDNLNSISLGTGITPISVQAGDSFTCSIMNNERVKCWGSGEDGRTGLGKTGATGDEGSEMGNNLDYVELFMPLEVFNLECDNCRRRHRF